MATILFLCILIWNILLDEVFAAERCYNIRKDEIYYCEWGCCGDSWSKGCCSAAGLIVGLSILGIIIIAVIIAVICCFIKHKGKSGRLIGSTTTTTVIGQQSYPMQPMATGSSGQPYGQPYGPPPLYQTQYPHGPPTNAVYGDPAYPPPGPPAYKH